MSDAVKGRALMAAFAARKRPQHFAEGTGSLAEHGIDPAEQHGFVSVPEPEWRDVQHRAAGAPFVRRSISTATPIHTGQPGVYADTVREYAGDLPRALRQDDPIEVINEGGKLYMGEGHHRLAGARAAGRKRITVHEYTPRPRAT